MNGITLFDFNSEASLSSWYVMDDVVMGGVSDGKLAIGEDGHGIYSGTVSLDNNGGFSSVRYRCSRIDVTSHRHITMRIKGDGKSYQLRIKNNISDYYSYIYSFDTSGEWETISVPMGEMVPSFRGRTLSFPNFEETYIEEVAILIGNKKNESFKLLIDKIELI